MTNIFFKDPQARLDYHVDWTGALPSGDFITQSAWEVPSELTASDQTLYVGPETDAAGVTRTVQRTTVWLQGGTDGEVYDVTNRITTAQGRVDDRTIHIRVKEK